MGAVVTYELDFASGREAFLRKHTGAFLWHVDEKRGSSSERWRTPRPIAFNTSLVDLFGVSAEAMKDYAVLPVQKKAGSAFADRISLGRATNCDLVVRVPPISKLHAHFALRDGVWTVCDAGSANGTTVNGLPLPALEPAALQLGDLIGFGEVGYRLLSASMLHDRLMPLNRSG